MIAIIVGTNAELIKVMPILKELDKRGLDYTFIHTGQHNISKLIEIFDLKEPDIVMYKPPKLSSRFMVKTHKAIFWGMKGSLKLKFILQKIKPSYVLYHGDTLSTAMAAIASSQFLNKKKTWKNAHLEAGLRSHNLFEPFPEEISRRIADKFSDILFAVSEGTKKNLEEENLKGIIVNVGNTIVDSVRLALNMKKNIVFKPEEKEYAIISIHRHENIKSYERLKKIVEIIKHVNIKAYWALHDNTRRQLEKFGLMKEIRKKENIEIMRLIPYPNFIYLLSKCKYIITDGGSIQEESLVLKKPCIILRKYTERVEGLRTGINFLTGLNISLASSIIKTIEENAFKIPKYKNPYGEGGSAKKIIDYLVNEEEY